MSYILDALKKSEGERVAEGEVPDWKTSHKGNYTPVPQGPTRQQVISISVLSAILVVLLISAAIWVFAIKPQQMASNDVAPVEVEPMPVTPPANPVTAKPAQRMSSAEFVNQLGGDNGASANANNKATKTTFEKFSQVQEDAEQNPIKSPKAVKPKHKKTSKTESVADKDEAKGKVVFLEETEDKPKKKKPKTKPKVVALSDLPSNIRRALPPIGFSGHVYSSEDPGQSSVMINGRKMKEGTSVTQDLVLEKITESGAQFSFRGHYFYLGALVDWQYTEK